MYLTGVTEKKVKFAPGTKAGQNFIPLAKAKLSSAAIRDMWIERCRNGEFTQLESELFSKGVKIRDFFEHQGREILNWAILSMSTSEQLQFIYEKVPNDLLYKILKEKNFSLLNTFLIGESYMEKTGVTTSENFKNVSKKIKLLLQIAPAIKAFMAESVAKADLGEKLKSSINQALKSRNLTKKVLVAN